MPHWGVGARLLSCASVLALGHAFTGGASAHDYQCTSITHPTTINHDKNCVRVTKTINGGVVNNATVGKTHGHDSERPGFFIGDGGLLKGSLVNNGWIFGGGEGTGALTLGDDADVQGGIINNGGIVSFEGSGISLGYKGEYDDWRHDQDWHHDFGHYGHANHSSYSHPEAVALTGDIINNGLIAGWDDGISARYGTMSGALVNNGAILGGEAGVHIYDSFTSWTGGIDNNGLIFGVDSGIEIGGGHHYGDGVVFAGGIANTGAIISKDGPSIAIGGASFSGGVYNNGLITQIGGYHDDTYSFGGEHGSPYAGVGIVFTAPTVEGGLYNDTYGQIYGTKGPAVWITDKTQSFSGGITNLGTIAGATDGIRIESAAFEGGLTNGEYGSIVGYWGDGVFASSAWTGNVENHGLISGAANGFAYDGSTFAGNFLNAGWISGGNDGVTLTGTRFDGAFTNDGGIAGGKTGVAMNFATVTGAFTNSGSIDGATGNGVALQVDNWGAADARADIVNTAAGVITGAETGFLLDVGTMYGDFVNEGSIHGDGADTGAHIIADAFHGHIINTGSVDSPGDAFVIEADWLDGNVHNGTDGVISGGADGLSIEVVTLTGDVRNDGLIEGGDVALRMSGETFDGAFTNTGSIDGGATGVSLAFNSVSGAFVNSGSINGGTGDGVAIDVETWGAADARADIVNTVDGVITAGDTGFQLDVGTLYGDFINDGAITGNGANTGVHITADEIFGDVVNNGSVDAPSDAFVVEANLLDGGFGNTGTIAGGVNGVVLDVGEITGGFTNSNAIGGESGNGVTITADTFDGAFNNTGDITGGVNGVVMVLGQETGGFVNSGSITGEYGNGVDIVVTDWGTAEARSDIVNTETGIISGGEVGLSVELVTLHGDITNEGSISGGDTGVLLNGAVFEEALVVENTGTFDGAFTNVGSIDGGVTGVAMNLDSVTGQFTNFGSINGTSGDGVALNVTTWGAADARADIVNATGGVITGGETGFQIDAGTVYGDFINDGSITGSGANTGVHIIADEYIGDLVNTGSVDSPSDAFVVEADLLDGSFGNSGTIAGGANGAVLVLGQMTGGFTNTGSISGEYANGVDIQVETWGSTEVPVEIVNSGTGAITGGDIGFALSAGEVHGSFINNGSIDGGSIGVSIDADTFDAPFANNGDITGGTHGVVMVLGQETGGFTNNGSITGESGNGVDILVESWGTTAARSDIVNTADGVITAGQDGLTVELATLTGDVVNDGLIDAGGVGVLLNGGSNEGVFTNEGTFEGAFTNTGTIDGGLTGVLFNLDTVTGRFTNAGSINGDDLDGVSIDVLTWGAANARADLVNTSAGTIAGGETGFLLDAGTVYGDFINDGAISGGGTNTGVHIIADDYFGDVVNTGSIDSPGNALIVDAGLLDGGFGNSGEITGGTNGATFLLGTMTGNFVNEDAITGTEGNGVDIDVGTWGSTEDPVQIVNAFEGTITGGETGFALDADVVHGAFSNDGLIEGGTTGASFDASEFDGLVQNTGDIEGGVDGVVMLVGQKRGNFVNAGSITGDEGDGVDIVVTDWGTAQARANLVNTSDGEISGGANGLSVELVTFHGDVTNNGSIEGGEVAVLLNGGVPDEEVFALANTGTFDGAFTNTGSIDGGTTGVQMTLNSVAGPFTNSGSIDGSSGDGVAIDVDTWGASNAHADIHNTTSGVISGGVTGFDLHVGTMYGDFINDGAISGGGNDTGLHITAGTYNGDIVNNGALSAPSNALHLEIETLNGEVLNTGSITAENTGGVAAQFSIGNGTTFTNTGGGQITGDVVFGGKAAYAFIAGNGGIAGDLIGEGDEGNDDTITVNGVHTFTGGTASNFASFTVEDGGVAFMGALSEGDPNGTGYAFENVDALNVNNGGLLYIDRSTTLNVGSLALADGGTVEFFLPAPGGEGFSDLTGSVIADPTTYGHIVVDGPATLGGNVVGFLDPAFAEANASLTQVQYNDVITASGGITGGFSTVGLIADSSIFELNDIIDGNSVHLHVDRTTIDLGDLSGIVVNLGGPFDSMVSERSNGIGSGSCGLAGDGWCFNQFAANEPGATQVMTDASPVDPFQWLRTGVRKVGETAAWGRGVGGWGRTDGQGAAGGSDYTVAGAIVGIDHVFSTDFMAGLAAQWTTSDVDFVGKRDNANVDSFEAGAYLSWGDTRLYLNANASVIFHSIDVDRFTPSTTAFGDYDGTTYSAFAEVGKTFETEGENIRIQPFMSLSFSHLDTDAYSETGAGVLLDVSGSDFDSLKGTAGLRVAYPIKLDSGRKMVPEVRLAWGHEFLDDQASFQARIQGQNGPSSTIRGKEFSRDTLIVGAGLTVPLSESASAFVDYDTNLSTDISAHTVSAGIRFSW